MFLQLVIPGLIERGGITFVQISLSRLIPVTIKSKIPTESSFSQSVRLNLSFNNALSDIMIYVWEYVMYDVMNLKRSIYDVREIKKIVYSCLYLNAYEKWASHKLFP